jgi:uncharacterized protein (TIGR02246 family)
MRIRRVLVAVVATVLLCAAGVVRAQSDEAAIKAVLEKSAVDWNRGDLDAFAASYKNSPDILFMGDPINKGYDAMLARYKRAYGTKDKMGVLTFSDIQVQPLDAKFATVTGKFHLERNAAGGGNADGYYLLVAEKTKDGWKIIRDSSTQVAKK